jgi:hypothetical protein
MALLRSLHIQQRNHLGGMFPDVRISEEDCFLPAVAGCSPATLRIDESIGGLLHDEMPGTENQVVGRVLCVVEKLLRDTKPQARSAVKFFDSESFKFNLKND